MDAGEEKVSSNNSVTLTGNCTAGVKPEDGGLHVAILLSVTSCIVILVMSLSFITCYLRERSRRRESARRSQKSLINDPLLEPYHTETPLFPLQRVPTPPAPALPTCSNTPVYLHFDRR